MNTLTQNLTIKENQLATIRYTRIVQQEWLKKIELKAVNDQIKLNAATMLKPQGGIVINSFKTSKQKTSVRLMKYLFPSIIVLLAVIILI